MTYLYRLSFVPHMTDDEGVIVHDPSVDSVEWQNMTIGTQPLFIRVRQKLDVHALYDRNIAAKDYPGGLPDHVEIIDMTGVL